MPVPAFVFAGVAVGMTAATQPAPPPPSPSDQDILKKLDEIQKRLDSLERQHTEDQAKIRDLERRLGQRTTPTDQGPAAPPAPILIEQPARPSVASPATPPPALNLGSVLGQGNLFNPQITAFFDMGASLSTNNADQRFNRFNFREAEVDLRAAISPLADGVLILSIAEEISQTPGPSGPDVSIDTNLEIEEGYINFHTLPFDLSVKAGKFRNVFGANNPLHTHDLPQVDRPLAVRAFLGEEGISTVGGSVSWLVPNPWDQFIELTGQIVNADSGPEAPILGGPAADNPAYLAHLKWFTDVGDDATLELGGSYLYSKTSRDPNFEGNVFGLDATFKWLDPSAPDSRSLLIQGEAFWAANDVSPEKGDPFSNDSFGLYAFAQYEPFQNWYFGVRGDYTQFPNSEVRGPDDSDWAISPYLSWYMTEFLRLRVEYQFHEFEVFGDHDTEHNVFFGLTYLIGAHPPHPYWVNR